MGTRIPLQFILQYAFVIGVLAFLGVLYSRKLLLAHVPIMAVMLIVPALVAFISVSWRNIYLERPLIASITLLIIPVSYFIVNAYQADKLLIQVVLIALAVIGMVSFIQKPRGGVGQEINRVCNGADLIYNTSVENQFTTSYYSLVPVMLWQDASVYLNQSIRDEYRWVFDWNEGQIADIPPGTLVCAMDYQYPHANPKERTYFTDTIYPLVERRVDVIQYGDHLLVQAVFFRIP